MSRSTRALSSASRAFTRLMNLSKENGATLGPCTSDRASSYRIFKERTSSSDKEDAGALGEIGDVGEPALKLRFLSAREALASADGRMLQRGCKAAIILVASLVSIGDNTRDELEVTEVIDMTRLESSCMTKE